MSTTHLLKLWTQIGPCHPCFGFTLFAWYLLSSPLTALKTQMYEDDTTGGGGTGPNVENDQWNDLNQELTQHLPYVTHHRASLED